MSFFLLGEGLQECCGSAEVHGICSVSREHAQCVHHSESVPALHGGRQTILAGPYQEDTHLHRVCGLRCASGEPQTPAAAGRWEGEQLVRLGGGRGRRRSYFVGWNILLLIGPCLF